MQPLDLDKLVIFSSCVLNGHRSFCATAPRPPPLLAVKFYFTTNIRNMLFQLQSSSALILSGHNRPYENRSRPADQLCPVSFIRFAGSQCSHGGVMYQLGSFPFRQRTGNSTFLIIRLRHYGGRLGMAIVKLAALHSAYDHFFIVCLVYRVRDALAQFDTALTLDPNFLEAQAALYNKACCHAYREEGKKAADCLRTALREYGLKFSTILNDPDLASFRATPEFKELQEEAVLGGEDIGSSFRRDLKLISEVQAPFRGIRRFFYVAFTAAAGISLLFTIPRLLRAVHGGEGAPDLLETAGNAGINIGGIVVLVALFFWDNKKEEEQLTQITRNETLSRLPLRLSTNRIVELVQLRDTARPGMPDWSEIVKEIPPMEAFLSKLER
ncbi:protein LOW PSII ACCUMULATION 1 [Striga asiatica]|uniref:Protein LOW PSII ACCUMULATION 1 n=1 Tax=Striga asiatica TaxID=4170 RepID=A0A5A7NWC3_STRAF|nr:protein LOW PSII ACCUMULATION 1 [Striga asiatica]